MEQNNKLSFEKISFQKLKEDPKKDCFAEIIESCLDNFLAQCWQWDYFPEFGSLIYVENKDELILGIVTQIQTGSMDPLRYPFPYQKTEEELLEEQPQIFEFLKTTFRVQILGFLDKKKDNKIFYHVPPKPCKIHSFVKNHSRQIFIDFFSKTDFLNILFSFSTQIPNLDELLLAILHNISKQNLLSNDFLDEFCKSFSLLTGNDYRRLKLFLKRIENLK